MVVVALIFLNVCALILLSLAAWFSTASLDIRIYKISKEFKFEKWSRDYNKSKETSTHPVNQLEIAT